MFHGACRADDVRAAVAAGEVARDRIYKAAGEVPGKIKLGNWHWDGSAS